MKNVLLLSLLSFFNDLTADMITPLLPAFLASMGLGARFLGVMEGLANSLSHLTVFFSGRRADLDGNSKRLTVWGYRLCAFIRPLLAIQLPAVTFAVRLLDRIGKGIRTAPRDKLLTASSDRKNWGKSFGLQRSFDHAGSLLAPAIAATLLSTHALTLPALFLLASLPAIVSVLIVPRYIFDTGSQPAAPVSLPKSWRELPLPLRRYLPIMLLSGLSTPSELFMILKMQKLGLPTSQVPWAWFLLTLFTLGSAYFGGWLSDRWSRRGAIALGWLLFVAVYSGFAFITRLDWAWPLVACYGVHIGIVEAPERSYPASVVPPEHRASALGCYYFAYGLGLFPASLAFGFIWDHWGSQSAFLINAALTAFTLVLLLFLPSSRLANASLPLPNIENPSPTPSREAVSHAVQPARPKRHGDKIAP